MVSREVAVSFSKTSPLPPSCSVLQNTENDQCDTKVSVGVVYDRIQMSFRWLLTSEKTKHLIRNRVINCQLSRYKTAANTFVEIGRWLAGSLLLYHSVRSRRPTVLMTAGERPPAPPMQSHCYEHCDSKAPRAVHVRHLM